MGSRRGDDGRGGPGARGHAGFGEGVGEELRAGPAQRPEPLARARGTHGGDIGTDRFGVTHCDPPTVGPRRGRRLFDPGDELDAAETTPARKRQPDRRLRRGRLCRSQQPSSRPARRGRRPATRLRAARPARPRAPVRLSRRRRAVRRATGERRAGRARSAATPMRARVGEVVLGGERVEQLVVVAEKIGLACEHIDEIPLRAALELRHHLAPQPYAPVLQLVVHRVVHGRESEQRADLDSVLPAQLEQRAAQRTATRRHACEPGGSAAAQQVQAARSRPDRRACARRGSRPRRARDGRARAPRNARRAPAPRRWRARRLRPARCASAPTSRAAARATTCRVVRAIGPQAMIDVHRFDVEVSCVREREQGERIGAAAAADHDPGAGREVVERDEPRRPRAEVRMIHAPTRASQSAGASSSGTVGRFSGRSQTASSARSPAERRTRPARTARRPRTAASSARSRAACGSAS